MVVWRDCSRLKTASRTGASVKREPSSPPVNRRISLVVSPTGEKKRLAVEDPVLLGVFVRKVFCKQDRRVRVRAGGVFGSAHQAMASIRGDVFLRAEGVSFPSLRVCTARGQLTGRIVLEEAEDAPVVVRDKGEFALVDDKVGSADARRAKVATEQHQLVRILLRGRGAFGQREK